VPATAQPKPPNRTELDLLELIAAREQDVRRMGPTLTELSRAAGRPREYRTTMHERVRRLREAGLVADQDPRAGVVLTDRGRAAIKSAGALR
jgi:DNA-binding IclR family transcriptional regulator